MLKKLEHGASWVDWPEKLRRHNAAAIDAALKNYQHEIELRKFEQYLFFRQWRELRKFAHQHGVYMFGDLPIFVSRDSADVWAQRENFTVDEHGNGTVVAGVPPDAFSDDGQLWGNPLFDWPTHKISDFSWWLDRLRTHFSLFDIIRIDHFRGLEACWEVPATSPTAKDLSLIHI